jgi:hypothetical protein
MKYQQISQEKYVAKSMNSLTRKSQKKNHAAKSRKSHNRPKENENPLESRKRVKHAFAKGLSMGSVVTILHVTKRVKHSP